MEIVKQNLFTPYTCDMKDIQDRKDIDHLVDEFYKKARKDDLIGIFFNEVIELNWEVHIPIICDFWESVVFRTSKYKGNPMIKHIKLHRMKALEDRHFDRWLSLWKETVEANFEGTKSELAVQSAQRIAQLMQFKIGSAGGLIG